MRKKVIKKSKVGRKWFDGKNEGRVVAKLEEVWAMGGTDLEACFYADISKDSLYRYLKEKPELSDRKEGLKHNPILRARKTIFSNLDNPKIAKWYLERKKKDEFSQKFETDINQENKGVEVIEIVMPKEIVKKIN